MKKKNDHRGNSDQRDVEAREGSMRLVRKRSQKVTLQGKKEEKKTFGGTGRKGVIRKRKIKGKQR